MDSGEHPTVGFLGLGVMGRPMAENLARSFRVEGFDSAAPRLQNLQGIKVASLGEIERCSVIVLSLPSAEVVESVLLGTPGIGARLAPGTLVIDLSTGIPSVSQRLETALRRFGVDYADAPVSGGEAGAKAGTLSIMVGAQEAVFARVLPYLKAMGKSVVRVGGVGSGNVAKLVNNMIVGVTFAAIAEGFALGLKNGLDPVVLHAAIRDGWAGSAVLEASAPAIVLRDYQPGGTINMIQKDLSYAATLAHESQVSLPMTSAASGLYQQAQAAGHGNRSQPALFELWATGNEQP